MGIGKSINEQLCFLRAADYVASNENPLASLAKGELWRTVTPIFIHLDWLHIAFNMIMFFQFGALIESLKGTVRLGGLILAIAVISNVAQAVGPDAWGGTPAFGGMSGVVYGLFGYVWIKSTFCPEAGILHFPRNRDYLAWVVVPVHDWGHWAHREHRARRGPGDGHGGGIRALVLETVSAGRRIWCSPSVTSHTEAHDPGMPRIFWAALWEESAQVADKFDPYREALVVETATVWPADCAHVEHDRRSALEKKLHTDPAACAQLEYIRVHTGFCRRITVTPADIARLSP